MILKAVATRQSPAAETMSRRCEQKVARCSSSTRTRDHKQTSKYERAPSIAAVARCRFERKRALWLRTAAARRRRVASWQLRAPIDSAAAAIYTVILSSARARYRKARRRSRGVDSGRLWMRSAHMNKTSAPPARSRRLSAERSHSDNSVFLAVARRLVGIAFCTRRRSFGCLRARRSAENARAIFRMIGNPRRRFCDVEF